MSLWTFGSLPSARWALAEWGRKVGVPGTMGIPEGLEWHLREHEHLDAEHARRAVALLIPQEIPLEQGGIDRQIEAAIKATRPATTLPRWSDDAGYEALLDAPMFKYIYTPVRPALYHRPRVVGHITRHLAHPAIHAVCGGFMPEGSVLTNTRPKHLSKCLKCFKEKT